MTSGALVPQDSFAQTGTFDWVQLGGGLAGFLARLQNYDVDFFTIYLGAQVATKLPLSPLGQKRVTDATNSLKSYTGFDPRLKFGVGIASILHILARRNEGLSLIGISAALSEVYHEDVVAKVLHELLVYDNPPREATPSLQNWSKIVRACAGTLANSGFGHTAEEMMRWHPTETLVFFTKHNFSFENDNHRDFNMKWRSRSAPRDIAVALMNLGKVMRGELDSITIVGGSDTGVLAAIAVWLFGMPISIIDSNGNEFYRNCTPRALVQAQFIYRNRAEVTESPHTALEAFEYPQKAIVLRDISDVIFANDENHELIVGSRIRWNVCLLYTFAGSFEKLVSNVHLFGDVLGCAAKIFEAIAKADDGIEIETRKHWIYYADGGSGLGYIQNLVHWFPELDPLQTAMRRHAGSNLNQARNGYESAIHLLESHCNCAICNPPRSEHDLKDAFCLAVLAETILKAGLILSNVSVEPGLEPRRAGLLRLYDFQLKAFEDTKAQPLLQRSLGPIVSVIEPERGDGTYYTVDHRMREMMDGALGLFTSINEIQDSSISAFGSNGICAYRGILKSLSIRDRSGYSLARIHIVRGRIEWDGNVFDQGIRDRYHDHAEEVRMAGDGRINPEELDFNNPVLVVEQSISRLTISYRLENSRRHFVNISPTHMANHALFTYGLFQCRHRFGDRPSQLPVLERDIRFQVRHIHGQEFAWYHAPSDCSFFAALTIADLPSPQYQIVSDDKCGVCAEHAALALYAGHGAPVLMVSF